MPLSIRRAYISIDISRYLYTDNTKNNFNALVIFRLFEEAGLPYAL